MEGEANAGTTSMQADTNSSSSKEDREDSMDPRETTSIIYKAATTIHQPQTMMDNLIIREMDKMGHLTIEAEAEAEATTLIINQTNIMEM
jgi:hypothetical protein